MGSDSIHPTRMFSRWSGPKSKTTFGTSGHGSNGPFSRSPALRLFSLSAFLDMTGGSLPRASLRRRDAREREQRQLLLRRRVPDPQVAAAHPAHVREYRDSALVVR